MFGHLRNKQAHSRRPIAPGVDKGGPFQIKMPLFALKKNPPLFPLASFPSLFKTHFHELRRNTSEGGRQPGCGCRGAEILNAKPLSPQQRDGILYLECGWGG